MFNRGSGVQQRRRRWCLADLEGAVISRGGGGGV